MKVPRKSNLYENEIVMLSGGIKVTPINREEMKISKLHVLM